MNMSTLWKSAAGAALVTIGLPSAGATQNLRMMAREHATQNPGAVLEVPAPPGDYLPTTFEELSRESDVVVQGKLVFIKSYLLGPSEDRVLSDYRLVAPNVLAGTFPHVRSSAPGPGAPLTISVYGGEVQLEGVQVRATDYNRGPIKDGPDYLLFLRQSRFKGAGLYEIYYAAIFEVAGSRLKPLLKEGRDVFEGSTDATILEVFDRVKKARSR